MAHRLVPKANQRYLSPDEIVRRLEDEFGYVVADREAGADMVGDMIAQFLRMRAPQELIESHRKAQEQAIRLLVADEPTTEALLVFVAMPNAGLFIDYHSRQHEVAADGCLHRCASALGYEIKLV